MNPERFFMPSYMGMRNVPMMSSAVRMTNSVPRSMGFFSKITNGIRSVNWSGLLTNANKTLDVVNQAIPLVRQAGPMVNNMKSMFRIARAFGNETIVNKNNKIQMNSNLSSENTIINNSNQTEQKKEVIDNNTLNFFI